MTINTNNAFCHSIITDEVRTELELYDDLAPQHDDVVKHEASDIRRVSHLGKGSYCDVSLVISRSTKTQLAMKKLDQSKIESSEDFILAAPDLAIEGHYLNKLQHPSIIKLRGTSAHQFSESFSEGGEGYFLTMDIMQETLTDRLQRWRQDPSSYKTKKGICLQLSKKTKKLDVQKMYGRLRTVTLGIAEALEYIHKEGVVLRDLKPDNVGFHVETGNVCLFDFGFARDLLICSPDEIAGTPRYMAPEVLRGEGYSFKSDVYSFGVVLHEVASLHRRQKSKKASAEQDQTDLKGICDSLSELQLNDIPCPKVKSLIECCLSEDPEKRPSFETIVVILTAILSEDIITNTKSKSSFYKRSSITKPSVYTESNSTLGTLPDYNYDDLCDMQNAKW